jgi:hypothetical protein
MLSYTMGPVGLAIRNSLGNPTHMDNSKIKKELKMEFIDVEKTIVDTVQFLKDQGLVTKKK